MISYIKLATSLYFYLLITKKNASTKETIIQDFEEKNAQLPLIFYIYTYKNICSNLSFCEVKFECLRHAGDAMLVLLNPVERSRQILGAVDLI